MFSPTVQQLDGEDVNCLCCRKESIIPKARKMGLESLRDIVGTCAAITTMGHMLSGTLICKTIYQKKTSQGIDPMPFIGGIGMCILMLRYALLLGEPSMINVNIFGLVTNIGYMSVYYLYSPNTDAIRSLSKVIAGAAVVLGYSQMEHPDKIQYRYGIIVTILFVFLLASPLVHLREIIRLKNPSILPFPMIFMGTLLTFQWLLYGIIINDVFTIFQNVCGFILSLFQLSLFWIFPSKPIENVKEVEKRKQN